MALDALTTDVFLPHGQCILWKPEVLWLHVVSDSLIALAYLAIPLSLLYFVQRRKDIPFSGMFLMFGAFIVACGTTHVMEVWTLWSPSYWLSGGIKALTAFISVATAVQLIPLIPKALALRSPAALEEINRSLEREVAERKRTEEKLRESEERFRLVFEGAPIGMGTAALDYRFMKVNKKLCDMLGYRESELMERTFTDITHPDDKTDTIQIAQQVMKTTDIQVYEKKVYHEGRRDGVGTGDREPPARSERSRPVLCRHGGEYYASEGLGRPASPGAKKWRRSGNWPEGSRMISTI